MSTRLINLFATHFNSLVLQIPSTGFRFQSMELELAALRNPSVLALPSNLCVRRLLRDHTQCRLSTESLCGFRKLYVLGVCDYRRGMGWWMDLYTPLGTTGNYSSTANLHTSQITTAHTKSSPARIVFSSCSLARVSNSGDSSASRAQILLVWRVSRNWALSIPLSTEL
jgi:hypothetical protein